MRDYKSIANTPESSSAGSGSSWLRLSIAGAFTGILVIAMTIKSDSAETAIIGGVVLFGIAYVVEAISDSPLLIARTLARIEQETQLALHQPTAHIVPPPALPLADTVQPPSRSFVAPVDNSDYREGLAYIAQLYRDDGYPDPKKVVIGASDTGQEGRLRIASPSKSTLEWLLSRGVLQPITKRGAINGYRLNTIAAPTLSDAHTALRQRTPGLPPYGGVGGEVDRWAGEAS